MRIEENLWPSLPERFHGDWRQDFKNAVQNKEELELLIGQELPEISYPIFIPRPYLRKILQSDLGSPLRLQFLPDLRESDSTGLIDPIGDQIHAKPGGIIHRYPNRVLYSPTEVCPIQCRYCFRKNELGQKVLAFKSSLEKAIDYIKSQPQVEEVILTGGDPLILGDEKLEFILESFGSLKQIKMIRLHTRTPVILPNRVTPQLLSILRKTRSKVPILTMVIHTNHISEWSPEFLKAINTLRQEPITLLSQSVLLRGVNDDAEVLKMLFMQLISWGVQPYYLHHTDDVAGAQHFRLNLNEGRKIYSELKKISSGIILPKYVIELPEGQGKAHAYSDQIADKIWKSFDGTPMIFRP